MNTSQKEIGIKELIAIIIITIGIKLTDDTPAILYQKLLNSAWIAPFIFAIVSIIPIYLLIKVISTYASNNLVDVLMDLFGKQVGTFLLLVLWIILSTTIIVDSSVYAEIIGTMYFPDTPKLAIYSLLMFVSAYAGKKGIEHIGSVAWFLLPYIKFSLLMALILTISLGNLDFIFPILGPGGWEVMKESTLKSSIYSDLIYICFLIPYMKNIRAFKKGTSFAVVILTIEMSISLFAYILLFDFETVRALNFPYQEVIRFLHIGFLTNIEMFFFPFWLIATFIRFSIYLYMNALIFGNIFKIKDTGYIIPILATLVVTIGMIPDHATYTLFLFRSTYFNYLTPFFILFPCLLWGIAKYKGVFRHDQKQTK
ncbi:MAG TPA: endospore germination permease [Virgibacillus sp.]|nr:endospore germination permease [Virgibacillus sp.]